MNLRLEKRYKLICEQYVQEFCKKQEMDFGGWTANIVGGIAYCSGFYFNFFDIVWDVNSNQKRGLIIDWYYYTQIEQININYFNYTKCQNK
jgi:hypothetical protein